MYFYVNFYVKIKRRECAMLEELLSKNEGKTLEFKENCHAYFN
jgi:hypothetical protein